MNNLRSLRIAKGISMKELGEVIGVSESAVSLYETGKRSPDIPTLIRLANFYGTTVGYIIGQEEKPTPVSESGQVNVVKIAGRDGSYEEKRLSDREMQALKAFVDLLPDAPEDL